MVKVRVHPLVALCAVALLAACAAPRVDGRDAEHARTSIAKVRRSVPDAKQQEFDSALRYLMAGATAIPTLSNEQVRAAVDGKTAEEIMAAARQQREGEARKRKDEALLREKQALDATLASIHQTDRDAAAKLGDIAPPPAQHLSPTELAALTLNPNAPYSGPVDEDVRSRCQQLAGTHSDLLKECLQTEMEGKRAVTGALVSGVEDKIAQRIRDNCARKYSDSYRNRQACENTDRDSLVNVSAHPDVMKALTPQRQQELRALMGQ